MITFTLFSKRMLRRYFRITGALVIWLTPGSTQPLSGLEQDSQLLAGVAESFQRPIEFFPGMRGGDNRPHARLTFRDGRKSDTGRPNPVLEKRLRKAVCQRRLPDNHGCNWSFADSSIKPRLSQALLEVTG